MKNSYSIILRILQIKHGLWQSQVIWKAAEVTEPSSWWQAYCKQRVISKVTLILLNIPSTQQPVKEIGNIFYLPKPRKEID